MCSSNENCIEWLDRQNRVTLSLTSRKYITKIKKLAEKFPDECDFEENPDSSIVAHVPLSWIKISRGTRNLTDEQRKAISDRMKSTNKSMQQL